ncbi:hypothetical protein [Aliiruegeria sabulilitoris]|uniref:hypothetical protein n=1 Tax=Aliiruegeria sabulilitoris TaxID=1510458 RepID=UPI000833C234|nr:hypothetical protein [Aliiruegeria sabulilitoris]NDR58604.1 hypothetical protein [Pseudoruegeria sp. M32A2M]
MIKITQTRGHWTAKVSGMGTLPVMNARDMQDNQLNQTWRTLGEKDTALAQKQFDAVVQQLTAGNPERRIRAVVVDTTDNASTPGRQLFEFTLENMKVDRFRNGTACYNYQLTDARELAL